MNTRRTALVFVAALFAGLAHANLVVEPVDRYFLVHNGGVAAKCPNGKVACVYEATATLEIRFVANADVSRAEAWRAVRKAYPGGEFYGALEDSACSKDRNEAEQFVTQVRAAIKAAKAPVEVTKVLYHCQVFGVTGTD